MDESISAELAGVSRADTRELDRVCERAARRLHEQGELPAFRIGSADFAGDPFLICADRYWRLRFLDEPTVHTATRCGGWLLEHADAEHHDAVRAKWALGYAFITKDTVDAGAEVEAVNREIMEREGGSADIAYFTALYHAGKLRANYVFTELHTFLESSLLCMAIGDHHQRDPLFRALRAFAAFGDPVTATRHAIGLLEQAWQDSDADHHVMDVALNALFAAPPFDGQGELLAERAAEAVRREPGNHVFHYRLARGRRLCKDFDAAAHAIRTAIEELPAIGTRGSHKELQQQYLMESNEILGEQRHALWLAEQRDVIEKLVADNAALRETVQSSPVRTIEVVALFTAAITFAVGTPQIVLTGDLPLGDRVILMAMFGGGTLMFALLIVAATWFITRVRSR